MSAAWGFSPLAASTTMGLLLVALGPGLLAACAGSRVAVDDSDPTRYRHRKLGYRISAIDGGPEDAWKRVDIEGADLAYRSATEDSVSISSSCRKTRAGPGILSRKLMIGTARERVLGGGPVAIGEDQGWTQTIETSEGGIHLRIKTVTLLSGGCVYDWVLLSTSPDSFELAEPIFDLWWQSFVAPEAEASRLPASVTRPGILGPRA